MPDRTGRSGNVVSARARITKVRILEPSYFGDGKDQHRPLCRQHGLSLRRVQAAQISGFGGERGGLHR